MPVLIFTHSFFFFNDTATTEIYTLSLHDALPISAMSTRSGTNRPSSRHWACSSGCCRSAAAVSFTIRSEEHTSELQSHLNLVCRLLLEKKKNKVYIQHRGDTRNVTGEGCEL